MRGTSLKYHIFKRNTPWGVIRNADGTLSYKHVMSFADNDISTKSWWEKRDIFIDTFLMKESEITGDQTWKTVVERKGYRAFDFLTDTKIIIRVSGSTADEINDLKNRDFMVAILGGKYHFYALKVLKIEGQTVSFEGEIDIFFTYKIRAREGSSNYIFRAHTNRIESVDSSNSDYIIVNPPKYHSTKTNIHDPNKNTRQFISTKLEPVNIEKSHFGVPWERSFLSDRFDAQNEFVSVKWMIMYVNKDIDAKLAGEREYTPFFENKTSIHGGKSLPFNVYCYPIVTRYKKQNPNIDATDASSPTQFSQCRIETGVESAEGEVTYNIRNRIQENLYEEWSDNTAHFKFILSPVPPINFNANVGSFRNGLFLKEVALSHKAGDYAESGNRRRGVCLDFRFVFSRKQSLVPSASSSNYFFHVIQGWRKQYVPGYPGVDTTEDGTGAIIAIGAIGSIGSSEGYADKSQFESKILFKNIPKIGEIRLLKNSYFNKISENNLDPKVFSPQYFSILVGTRSQQGKEYDFFKLIDPTILKYLFNLDPSAASIQWFFEESTRNAILEMQGFIQILNGEMPTGSDPDQLFWRNNRYALATQRQQALRTKWEETGVAASQIALSIAAVIGGAVSMGAGKFQTGAGGIGGGLAGIVQGTGNVLQSARTYDYTMQNINNSIKTSEALPDDITSLGSNFFDALALDDIYTEPQVRSLSVSPSTQIALSKFFNINGWSYQDFFNINSYLENRYFFNFIQASDVFNVVKTTTQNDSGSEVEIQLSSPMKQIISNAFSDGVTFHHFRKIETWRGVMGSYDIVNFETELESEIRIPSS